MLEMREPTMREGDIVVTRVGHHYSLGRLTADGETQTPLEQQAHRPDALSRACQLAGADRQVFILEKSGSGAYSQFDCTTLSMQQSKKHE
jgi:hypothetical protein